MLESAAMKTCRNILAVLAGSAFLLAVTAGTASAQVSIDPSTTPAENKSPLGPLGPLPSLAAIFAMVGVVVVAIIVFRYMRYAPRFARDEETKVVRADRVQIGQELPRRNVDISKAAPVVVAPPPIPVAVGAATPAAPMEAAAAAPEAPSVVAPAVPAAPAAPPGPAAPPAAAAAAEPATAPAPAAAAPAAAPLADPPQGRAPAAPAEHQEVTMDQGVYDQTLKELLDAGTDRRIAEGKARRAGMIAAKKAAGLA